jgi:HlyD family secretion protein
VIARRRDGAVLRQLQTLYNIGNVGELTDGQLLERFATDTDEVAELAFSALVERHQALVWRVCLAILRDGPDAEDAFQATFLVLVRRARSLWVRDSLGPWLHQVACRTASCLRGANIRRRKHERRSAERIAARTFELGPERDPDRDAAIHDEVNRLPEKYRAPVVLCDLEGRTHHEAAGFLGWPVGTVKSRQSQGRGLIRDRLTRRGIGLAVAGAALESMTQTIIAAIPKELSQTTVGAAMRQSFRLLPAFGASARVLTLTHGVLRAMFWSKLRFIAMASLLAVGIATGGAIVYVRGAQDPAPHDAQAVSKRPTTTTTQAPQPNVAKKAPAEPKTTTTEAMLRAQRRTSRRAKAHFEMAAAARELAEIAVEEYRDATYPNDLATVEGEVKLAESALKVAEDRVDAAERALKKGTLLLESKVSEELMLKKARFYLVQAQSKRKVLVDFTRDKTVKELRNDVMKAVSDELAKKVTWELEQGKERILERELRRKSN